MNTRIKAARFGFELRKLLKPISPPIDTLTFKSLWKSEWSIDFENCQRHRLVQGALRYGRLNSAGKNQWDRPKDIINRIIKYQETHNLEHLVDAANLCLLEFEEGRHPDRHFLSSDDAMHTKKLK